ncbi:MAG: hypothetical protein EOO81_11110 [Oxalobacteraceae bacterium]|nr:MAG: hypothetical protein EOO81_11110 [Oxalobacteraceae bacterium]
MVWLIRERNLFGEKKLHAPVCSAERGAKTPQRRQNKALIGPLQQITACKLELPLQRKRRNKSLHIPQNTGFLLDD